MLNNGSVGDSLAEMFRLFAKWEEGAVTQEQGMMEPDIKSEKEMGSDCLDETDGMNHEGEGLQKYDETPIAKKDVYDFLKKVEKDVDVDDFFSTFIDKSMKVEKGMATEDPEEAENPDEIGEEKSETDEDTVTVESLHMCDTFELAQISRSGSLPRDDDNDTTVSFIEDYYSEDVLTQNEPRETVAINIDTDSERNQASERGPTKRSGMFSRVLQTVLRCFWNISFWIGKLRRRRQSRNTSPSSSFMMLDEFKAAKNQPLTRCNFPPQQTLNLNHAGTDRRWKFGTLFSMVAVIFTFIFYLSSVYVYTASGSGRKKC